MQIALRYLPLTFLTIGTLIFVCFAKAEPSPLRKPTAPIMKKSEIPPSVIKDIQRVHPGMTRADLLWLFTPDGGLFMATPRAYVYRYAGFGVAGMDTNGKPELDKVTHKPVIYGMAIKIDVTFKPAAPQAKFISSDGSADDIIVTVSKPYTGFANDN